MTADPAEHAFNLALGRRLREGRLSLTPPMSLQALAGHLNVSFQMVQKYENGTCRLPVTKLVAASHTLRLPVDFLIFGFHEGSDYPTPPTLTPTQLRTVLKQIAQLAEQVDLVTRTLQGR